jgi:adenylate cyclase class 2
MLRAAARQETEIKLAISSAAAARRLLRRAGFRVCRRRVYEDNLVFDTPGGQLRASGKLLRLRRSAGAALLTFKGPASQGKHKSRLELEVSFQDFDVGRQILLGLGYGVVFEYEKYRTEYGRPGSGGTACLDETPIGVFIELEGPPDWIDATAESLGFHEHNYITDSYLGLFRRRAGEASPRMCCMRFPRLGLNKAHTVGHRDGFIPSKRGTDLKR